tara:strand:+ start:473 stop:835 length:363 start_codon:yes stop_codon:yes gene_type:complete
MRLGGSGVYDGHEDWHPAFLTIGCAIQVKDNLTFEAVEPVWIRLPMRIVYGCDDLREKVYEELSSSMKKSLHQHDLLNAAIGELKQILNRYYGINQLSLFEDAYTKAKSEIESNTLKVAK